MADVQGRARPPGWPIPTRDSAKPIPANLGELASFRQIVDRLLDPKKDITRSSL
jgi:hypothetical protein